MPGMLPARLIHATNSQVISQALVSATNCVDPAFALHASLSLALTNITAYFIPSLYMHVSSTSDSNIS